MLNPVTADGFRCLVYVHFGTFGTDDSIDKVSAGTRKVVSEVVGLFGDQGGDGVVRQEFRTCSTEGSNRFRHHRAAAKEKRA